MIFKCSLEICSRKWKDFGACFEFTLCEHLENDNFWTCLNRRIGTLSLASYYWSFFMRKKIIKSWRISAQQGKFSKAVAVFYENPKRKISENQPIEPKIWQLFHHLTRFFIGNSSSSNGFSSKTGFKLATGNSKPKSNLTFCPNWLFEQVQIKHLSKSNEQENNKRSYEVTDAADAIRFSCCGEKFSTLTTGASTTLFDVFGWVVVEVVLRVVVVVVDFIVELLAVGTGVFFTWVFFRAGLFEFTFILIRWWAEQSPESLGFPAKISN